MLKLAVTGNIASGKSLFTSFLAKRGAFVIDADRIGHDVLKREGPAFDQVLAAFGNGILGADGEIDRKVLGPIVFADPARRRMLEEIVHPLLIEEIERRLREAEGSGEGVAVVDAALVYELEVDHLFDRVIVVTSPPGAQIQRLLDKGLSDREARARIASQLDPAEKVRRAAIHVTNSGTPDDLDREAGRVWQELIGNGGRRKAPDC